MLNAGVFHHHLPPNTMQIYMRGGGGEESLLPYDGEQVPSTDLGCVFVEGAKGTVVGSFLIISRWEESAIWPRQGCDKGGGGRNDPDSPHLRGGLGYHHSNL